MELNLIEKFILLTLDTKKGRFLIDSLSLNYGIAGAILLELSEMNKIKVQQRKLHVIDFKLSHQKIIDACIKLIHNSKKPHKVKYWINKIGNKSTGFKKVILNDLSNKNIIRIDKVSYVMGLVTYYRYPFVNPKPINEIKAKLRRIVLQHEDCDLESILLLSLMNSCKLTRILFENKKEHKAANQRINELTKNIEISNAVGQTLKEIQTAVLVATTSAFIGSSSY